MTTEENEFDFPDEILKRCVFQMYSKIVAGFDPKGNILNSLFEKGMITLKEKRKIGESPEERGSELVDVLLSCHRPNAIAKFLQILSISDEAAYKWIPEEVYKAAKKMVAAAPTSASQLERKTNSDQLSQEIETNKTERKCIATEVCEAVNEKVALPQLSASSSRNEDTFEANQRKEPQLVYKPKSEKINAPKTGMNIRLIPGPPTSIMSNEVYSKVYERKSEKINAPKSAMNISLIPGHPISFVSSDILIKEKNRCRSSFVPIGRPSFYSRSEMDRLLQKAVDRMQGAGSAKVEWLYRNKSPEYFRDIEVNQDGVMRAVMKDNGGDPRCPINNKIEGLYFLASVEPSTGQPIPNSPFGSTRLLVPPGEYGNGIMLDRNANLYFADFFCLQDDTHYVTLVVTPNRWCDEDAFCKQHLVPLHWINNPFLFKNAGVPHVGTARNTLIEVFCTFSLNLKMIRNCGAKIEENIPTFGRGGARGLQKNPHCPTCNI